MKQLILSLIFLAAFAVFAQQELKGTYQLSENNAQVEIASEEGTWQGKLVASDEEQAPLGMLMLKDFKKEGIGYTAKLYAPKRREWYPVTLNLAGNVLTVEVSVGMFSKTLEWSKIK